MNLRELVRETAQRLRRAPLHYGHGTSNAGDEAAFLVLRGLGLPFEAPADRRVSPGEVLRIERLLRSRIRDRIPAAYLLHEAWLAGERFYVDRRVIVPRSHIAFLLARLGRPKRVLDLCTGSGCLAILAAQAFPQARVDGVDLSARALAVARRNVTAYRLRGRVALLQSDLFSGLGGRRYDLILCNPPYVTGPALRALPREYGHEPRMALAGGKNGLALVRRIMLRAVAHLRPKGRLVCEIGNHRKALVRLFPRTPFRWPADQVFQLSRADLPREENVG